MSVDHRPTSPEASEPGSDQSGAVPMIPHDALESAAVPDQPLPDVPMARPISTECLTIGQVRADTLPSSTLTLTPWRAVLQIILLVAAGFAGILVGTAVTTFVKLPDPRWDQMITTGVAGLACILAAFALVRSVGQRLSAIGWRVNNIGVDVSIGVTIAFGVYMLMMVGAMVLVLIRPDLLENSTKAQQAIEKTIPRTSVPAMIAMMAFVALWEEVVFRGFLLTRLYVLFKRWWLTVPVGAVLFSLGHGYQGHVATLIIACVGVLMGALFVWRRSLLPAVAFHMVFNLIGLLLLRSQSNTWH